LWCSSPGAATDADGAISQRSLLGEFSQLWKLPRPTAGPLPLAELRSDGHDHRRNDRDDRDHHEQLDQRDASAVVEPHD